MFYGLTSKGHFAHNSTMTNHTARLPRISITLTGDDVLALEELKRVVEQQSRKRLSLAQLVRQLCNDALANKRK